jgi:hypothetical protein
MNNEEYEAIEYPEPEDPQWAKDHSKYNAKQDSTNGANLNHGNKCFWCNYASLMSRNDHFDIGTSEGK